MNRKEKLQEVRRQLAAYHERARVEMRAELIEARVVRRTIFDEMHVDGFDSVETFERIVEKLWQVKLARGDAGGLCWWYALACSPSVPFADTVLRLAAGSHDAEAVVGIIDPSLDEIAEHLFADTLDDDEEILDVFVRLAFSSAIDRVLVGAEALEKHDARIEGFKNQLAGKPHLRAVH